MPRLMEVADLCSSTVSDTANRLRKTRKKNPLPYLISERSHVGNLRQIRKQGKGRSSKRKENRRLSFLFVPAAGAATLPPSADGALPAEVQRKAPRPLGANPLTQFVCPGQPVQRKEPPRQGEHADAVRASRSAGAEKTAARQGEHADAVRASRSAGAEKGAARQGEHADAVRAPRSAGAEKTAARTG